ncbi:MAG: aldehyde dehydrogenase family protein, partial [Pseudomonadota bacterium]|nr:aldehyde dehydrogenase family protein [Pseudomonadota bacterium]
MKSVMNFIDGEFRAAADGRTFEKRSPVHNGVIARVAEAGRAEVDQAVAGARAALQGPWGCMSLAGR